MEPSAPNATAFTWTTPSNSYYYTLQSIKTPESAMLDELEVKQAERASVLDEILALDTEASRMEASRTRAQERLVSLTTRINKLGAALEALRS